MSINFPHVVFTVLSVVGAIQNLITEEKPCNYLSNEFQAKCSCDLVSNISWLSFDATLNCQGIQDLNNKFLSSSKIENEEILFKDQISSIIIADSDLKCPNILKVVKNFKKLRNLSITRSKVQSISNCHSRPTQFNQTFEFLQQLDLSMNNINKVEKYILDEFTQLKVLNLSNNEIASLDSKLFENLVQLQVLDLSSNKLNHMTDPLAFLGLTTSLNFIDISNNSWTCSPQLAWLYNWSIPYISNGIIAKVNTTRCRYDGSFHDAMLLLVMEYYTKEVLPNCPLKDGCQCYIENIQEKIVVSTERHYAVFVSCPNNRLSHFPKLPKHTRSLDLSRNRLSNDAFKTLKVIEDNYNEVENLTLNDNFIESLPEILLEMKLGIRFSAKGNKLQSISYDFSQHMVRATNIIELGGNPWVCTCNSQITDLILLSKIRDKKSLYCATGSDSGLLNKQIFAIDPEVLCPPDHYDDESHEILLQIICLIFVVFIISLLSKLTYDSWVYRTRGQLPWLVLKMP